MKNKAPDTLLRELADRFRARRLRDAITQQDLARNSGVSLGSLKRFESRGLIALDSLLRIAAVLGCLEDFDRVCASGTEDLTGRSLDELLQAPRQRKRGRSK